MEVFSPQDNIIMSGEMGTELFFLVSGSVTVRNPTDDTVLRTLDEGSFFGEVALFFPEHGHSVNVKASSFGWLLVVERDYITQLCSDELLEAFRGVALERAQHEFASLGRNTYLDGKDDLPSPDHPALEHFSPTSSARSYGRSGSQEKHQLKHHYGEEREISTSRERAMPTLRASLRSQVSRDAATAGQLSDRDSAANLRRHSHMRSPVVDGELWDFASRMEAKIDAWAGHLEQRLAAKCKKTLLPGDKANNMPWDLSEDSEDRDRGHESCSEEPLP